MAKRPWSRRAVLLGSVLAIIGIMVGGSVGYWEYASYVPPFRPQFPPTPSRNGYIRAERLVTQLYARIPKSRPLIYQWPFGSPDQLRSQLVPVRPILDRVRTTLPLEWMARPVLSLLDTSGKAKEFDWCARAFAAESVVARSQGDYVGAMQRSLDAMELGSKVARGGGILPWMVALRCHAHGLAQAERTAFLLPRRGVLPALERTRHIRDEWPSLTQALENDRISELAGWTQCFELIGRQPLFGQLDAVKQWTRNEEDPWKRVRLLLEPRRTALANLERYLSAGIAESQKPVRRRRMVPAPSDAWGHYDIDPFGADALLWEPWRWERMKTDLVLLEVGLAVRLHYLELGRYPNSLSDISKQWLSVPPVDLWDQPIAYRLKNGQPLIYSLGPDGKDNGGLPLDPSLHTATPSGDLVFGRLTRSRQQW